jgi:hypothetical protein
MSTFDRLWLEGSFQKSLKPFRIWQNFWQALSSLLSATRLSNTLLKKTSLHSRLKGRQKNDKKSEICPFGSYILLNFQVNFLTVKDVLSCIHLVIPVKRLFTLDLFFPLKGTVSRDFWPSVFFVKQSHLGPWLHPKIFSISVSNSLRN